MLTRLWRPRAARLRVGLAPVIAQFQPGTGHGVVWANVVAQLRRFDDVKLVRTGSADVWLASAHDPLPDERPLVVQVHEASWREPELRAFLHEDLAAHMEAATSHALDVAEHVITPSHAARDQVIAAYGLAADRVHAVAHGVDHDVFRPRLEGGRELVGAPYVLFVGVLHPRKNVEAVRQAALDLAQAGDPHVLAIVGNPPPEPQWQAFADAATAELPGHPGRVAVFRALTEEQLAALMAGASVFCLPSHYEGFGLPALEAMACGAPVVASDRGALPEVVDEGGLVVGTDPAEVSVAVRRVLGDDALAGRLRSAALQRASSFSWERTARGWLEVLRLAV